MTKVAPSRVTNFIVADALRQEATGKITIIGAFAAASIFLFNRPTLPVGMPLAFYIVFKDGEGTFVAQMQIFGPDKKPIGERFQLGTVTQPPKEPLQLLVNFATIILPALGEYRVEILLDGNSYTESFTVGYGEMPQFKPPSV
jgi:hypothetical protein